jgi:sugar phosphate isomerase/epimerase
MLSIQFYYPRWGAEALRWEAFLAQIKEAGFDGTEVYPLQVPAEKQEMLGALKNEGLEFSLLHTEMTEGKNFERYKQALERNLYELVNYQDSRIRPKFITSQTGREYYTKDQMAECFDICERISRDSGIRIIQETHRNKWSYAAHVVKEYLQEFPSLKLALDLSHWVCVSESYLEDQEEAVNLAIQHAVHLHARVGHTQGPQVTDPRAAENKEALAHHLQWWDKWIAHLLSSGQTVGTITPEFGPYPYMSYKPHTHEPVASQWEINCFMKGLLQDRYKNLQR